MRIVLVVHQFLPRYSSGTEVLTFETAQHFRARGHEVHVLTAEPVEAKEEPSLTVDSYEGIPVHRILRRKDQGVARITRHYTDSAVHEMVGNLFRRLRPDIVHVHHLYRLSGSVVKAAAEA